MTIFDQKRNLKKKKKTKKKKNENEIRKKIIKRSCHFCLVTCGCNLAVNVPSNSIKLTPKAESHTREKFAVETD